MSKSRLTRLLGPLAVLLAVAPAGAQNDPTPRGEAMPPFALDSQGPIYFQFDPNQARQPGFPGAPLRALQFGYDATGLALAPADETLRAHLDLPEGQGLVVTFVVRDSQAEASGLKVNDIILSVGDKPARNAGDMVSHLTQKAASATGDDPKTTVKILRGGKEKTIDFPLANWRRPGRALGRMVSTPHEFWIGVTVAQADETLRSQLDVLEGRGLIVTSIVPDGPADRAKIQRNDILLELDGQPLEDVPAMVKQIQALGEKSGTLKLIHGGKTTTVEVTPRKREGEAVFREDLQRLPGVRNRFFQVPRPGVVVPPAGAAPGQPFHEAPLMRPIAPRNAQMDEVLKQLQELRKAVEDLKAASGSGRDSEK
jgi:membrane-associated protease RseP (regulator of RpoE activity)